MSGLYVETSRLLWPSKKTLSLFIMLGRLGIKSINPDRAVLAKTVLIKVHKRVI